MKSWVLLSIVLYFQAGAVLGQEECVAQPDEIPHFLNLLMDVDPKEPINGEFIDGASGAQRVSHSISSSSGGYVFVDHVLARRLNALSCATHEIAINITAALLSKQFHPFIRIADMQDPPIEGLSIGLDTKNGKLILIYQHQGEPHTERIDLSIATMRWRSYIFVFSGNLFKLISNCEVILEVDIPAPDLCFVRASTISLGEGVLDGVKYTMEGAIQEAVIIFGNNGYMKGCGNLQQSCGTCAKIRQLENQLEFYKQQNQIAREKLLSLETRDRIWNEESLVFKRLDFFENFRKSKFVSSYLSRSPNTNEERGDENENCYIGSVKYESGVFFTHTFNSFQVDKPCMCFFGTILCQGGVQRGRTIDSSCTFTSAATGEVIMPADSVITLPNPKDNQCHYLECGSIDSTERETKMVGQFCPFFRDDCDKMDNPDPSQRRRYRLAVCCGLCNPCDNGELCARGSTCVVNKEHGNFTCECHIPGRLYNYETRTCSSANECLMNPKLCPIDSKCIDLTVGYECNCTQKGYFWNRTSNSCEDTNECEEFPEYCNTGNRMCRNTEGSYACVCREGFKSVPRTEECIRACSPDCINGGTCNEENVCVCPEGFTGSQCEQDIDECEEGDTACGNNEVCVNTMGSHYCRCAHGYKYENDACVDINECKTEDGNMCHSLSQCENTPGSYDCYCTVDGDRFKCTGSCVWRGKLILHGISYVNNNCKLCQCNRGSTICTPLVCDCSDFNMKKSSCCRGQCAEVNGCIVPDQPPIPVGQTRRSSDGCRDCTCHGGTLDLRCQEIDCPLLRGCPRDLVYRPNGTCCDVCKVPACNRQNDGQRVLIDNGCRACTCRNRDWTCLDPLECAPLDCEEKDQVYNPGVCCPECRSNEIIGSSNVCW